MIRCLKTELEDLMAHERATPSLVIARERRAIQYPGAPVMESKGRGVWILRWSLSSGSPEARPGGGV